MTPALQTRFRMLAAFMAAIVLNGPASAELRVMESTVPGIAPEATFPDNAVFDLPAGKKLKFLKTPANTTHDMEGPYHGTLGAYRPPCSWADWARGKCSASGTREGGTYGHAR